MTASRGVRLVEWFAVRLCRLVVVIYPAAFRRAYRDEVESVFRRGLQRAGLERGWLGALGFGLRSVGDTILSAARMRFSTTGRRPRQAPSPKQRGALAGAIWHDVRYALRTAGRRPALPVAVIVTMALSIGATSAVFSVIEGVLLSPLPFPNADRIVRLVGLNARTGAEINAINLEDARDWRDQTEAFSSVAAYAFVARTLAGDGDPERVSGVMVSEGYFDVFGLVPAAGRFFRGEEHQFGSAPVVVLSAGMWERRFGGDPDVVGTAIHLDDVPFTIIGVAPATGFDFPSSAIQFWTPLLINPTSWQFGRGPRWLSAVGRLRGGVGVPDAQAAVDVVVRRLAEAYPETNEGRAVRIRTLQDAVVGPAKPLLTLLVGTVAFVLLMGCMSVANLLLARGAERRREFAVRMALGASQRRLAGQVLTEGLVLAVAAGAAGTLIAHWGVGVLVSVSGSAIPRQSEIGIDARVLGFTLLVALGTGLVFALAPAARAARIESTSGMQDVKGGGPGVLGLRNALVMTQTAFSVVLLIGAALLLQSLARLSRVDTGYDPSGAVSFTVSPPVARYPTPDHVKGFYRDVLGRIAALPEVTVASVGDRVPLAGGSWFDSFRIQGSPSSGQDPVARIRVIAPDYFRALGVPVQQGRSFTPRDDLGAPSVAMVNAAAARQYFDGGDPMGRGIEFFGEVWQVVGVVGNVRHAGPGTPARPALYLPWPQSERIQAFWRQGRVVVRTAGDPNQVVALLRQAVHDVDPAIALGGLGTLQATLSASLSPSRFRAALIGLFAVLALVLSVVGIYSVIAYTVSRRTRELGIRIALGSRVQAVEWLVVRRGLAMSLGAILVGTVGALGLTRFLSSFLFEVTATDPWTFVVVPGILLGVGVAASYLPARRAGRIDPLAALKSD